MPKMTKTKIIAKKTRAVKKTDVMSCDVYGITGEKKGTLSLPKNIFGARVNDRLIAQAVRVHLANQRVGCASTKTRGEVEGSTRKIYKQKGTCRARHGGIRAPIFVGGGIVFGPKPRDYSLKFPRAMKKASLTSVLSQKQKEAHIAVIEGTEKIEPKTKQAAALFHTIGISKNILIAIHDMKSPFVRASRNLNRTDMVPVGQMTTYDIVTHDFVFFTKEAVAVIEKRLMEEK